MGDRDQRRPARAFLVRLGGTVSDANNLVQLAAGAVGLLVAIGAWWRFGVLAAVAVGLLALLLISIAAGMRAEREVQRLSADDDGTATQTVFVPMMSDEDVQRQLLANADQLAALQAASRRRKSWSSMASLDAELDKGPPLFDSLRAADFEPEGRVNEATVKARLHQWASVVALLTDDLWPEVPEGFHMPYYGYPTRHRGDPPLTVRERAEAVIAGYERFHREWADRVAEHYRTLPSSERPKRYRD